MLNRTVIHWWHSNTILKIYLFGYLTRFINFGKCGGSCQIVSSKNESQDGLDTSCSPCKVHYRVHGSGTFLTRVAFVPIVHRPTPHAPGTRPAHSRPTSDPHQVLTPCELSYLRPLTILTPLKLSQLTFHIRLNRHIFSFSPNRLYGFH